MTHSEPTRAITGVVFDFYGTLTPGTSLTDRDHARGLVAEWIGCDPVAMAAAIRDTFDQRARGAIGGPIATMRWLAARCGHDITDEQAAEAYARRVSVERAFMAPRPETLEVLATLAKTGLRIGVLSDCTDELPQCWPDLPYAPFVDAAVFSVEEGLRKPDPAMYARICERLRVGPADCLYVGDGGSNELTGAAAAGFHAIQLRGPEFATSHTYDAESAWRGDEITDLREVYRFLDGASPPSGRRERALRR